MRAARVGAVVLAAVAAVAPAAAAGAQPARAGGVATPQQRVSTCAGPNAEVEEAVHGRYVYVLWMGCNVAASGTSSEAQIGFARSADGGLHFGPARTVPGSWTPGSKASNAWDPAITVAPNGTVYASFMYYDALTKVTSPKVAVSTDHGTSFRRVSALPVPPTRDRNGNWGDRDFVAVGPNGTVYVTWDYGPSSSAVKSVCAPNGSCGFSAGDLNVVEQHSTDGGRTWTRVHPVSPHFPISGADSAPLVVQPNGTIDVLYQGYHTNPRTLALSDGGEYFTRSTDGGATWSRPVHVGARVGTESLSEWWIDGDLATDRAGNLYATWDTQSATADIGWLATSADGGTTWSGPIRVAGPAGTAEELTEVSASRPGLADVAWQTPSGPGGYATYLRPYSLRKGWLTPAPQRVSTRAGNTQIWPGDTFGIANLPVATGRPDGPPVVLAWGSAVHGSPDSEVWSSVALPGPRR